ncbi:MAG: DUF2235 domain-containing protein [Beijerinckiaceae bacterium]|nr:DUF2235 domain-containing protein [Beijerinckiaceae bacterium]
MKRLVILIDGTWGVEGTGIDTNVAKLDPKNTKAGAPLIRKTSDDGIQQAVFYHEGVGAESDLVKHWLGGAIGLGLKDIVLDAYKTVVQNYEPGDDLIICGFSRGAYAARALAGLIGASGIQRRSDPAQREIAWQNYRVAPSVRTAPAAAGKSDAKSIADYRGLVSRGDVHDARRIKCVAVWDTVGSYGIPAGFGLAALSRYITLAFLGFHDTQFGSHVEIGLHGLAIDEHRHPFVPTLWTAPRNDLPHAIIEQTWFAGSHGNIGGGETDPALSDIALLWMIARLQSLTGLTFATEAVKSATAQASALGAIYDSTQGWPIDSAFPHFRKILSAEAIHHGWVTNSAVPGEVNINERVHWSAIAKRNDSAYAPPNLPAGIPAEKIAAATPEERAMLPASLAAVV